MIRALVKMSMLLRSVRRWVSSVCASIRSIALLSGRVEDGVVARFAGLGVLLFVELSEERLLGPNTVHAAERADQPVDFIGGQAALVAKGGGRDRPLTPTGAAEG